MTACPSWWMVSNMSPSMTHGGLVEKLSALHQWSQPKLPLCVVSKDIILLGIHFQN